MKYHYLLFYIFTLEDALFSFFPLNYVISFNDFVAKNVELFRLWLRMRVLSNSTFTVDKTHIVRLGVMVMGIIH